MAKPSHRPIDASTGTSTRPRRANIKRPIRKTIREETPLSAVDRDWLEIQTRQKEIDHLLSRLDTQADMNHDTTMSILNRLNALITANNRIFNAWTRRLHAG